MSQPEPHMTPIEDRVSTPMAATEDYASRWRAAGLARWWMAQPDYEDDPAEPGFGQVGPIRGQDLLPPALTGALSETFLYFLNRCWGTLAQMRHPDWPAIEDGARPGAWQWTDPNTGPDKFLQMMEQVGQHVVDMTDAATEQDQLTLHNIQLTLAKRRS